MVEKVGATEVQTGLGFSRVVELTAFVNLTIETADGSSGDGATVCSHAVSIVLDEVSMWKLGEISTVEIVYTGAVHLEAVGSGMRYE